MPDNAGRTVRHRPACRTVILLQIVAQHDGRYFKKKNTGAYAGRPECDAGRPEHMPDVKFALLDPQFSHATVRHIKPPIVLFGCILYHKNKKKFGCILYSILLKVDGGGL